MLRVRNKLWLVSDTHFGHHNIIKFQQRPATHEIIMLSEWIWRVGEHDQILHLGDVVVGRGGNPKRWLTVINRLPGEKFLIKGNHDKMRDSFYEAAGFTIVPEFVYKTVAFTHRPLTEDMYDDDGNEWTVNVHGHTHSNEYKPEHDGILLPGKVYKNVCVEHTELAPVQLGNVHPF